MAEKDMSPTLGVGSWYGVEPYKVEPIKGWHIVRFREPKDTYKEYRVLRVVGVPGDQLKLDFYGVWINGELQNKRYPAISYVFNKAGIGVEETITIPNGMYFLLGDNFRVSRDSRHFGLVPKERIVGRVVKL